VAGGTRGVPVPREPALHHALDQALHLGYGATLGAVYGLGAGRVPGLGFGLATWFMAPEMARQPDHRPSSDAERHAARTG
jgi:hypothetical protein